MAVSSNTTERWEKDIGVDGKASLKHEERLELIEEIGSKGSNWEHQKLGNTHPKGWNNPHPKVPLWQTERAVPSKICLRTSTRSNLPGVTGLGQSTQCAKVPVRQSTLYEQWNRKTGHRTRHRKMLRWDISHIHNGTTHRQGVLSSEYSCLKAGVNPEYPREPQGSGESLL